MSDSSVEAAEQILKDYMDFGKNRGTGGSDFDLKPVPAVTDAKEPEMLSKYSAFAGKLYKVKGMTVWMSTENGAREIYRKELEINAQS